MDLERRKNLADEIRGKVEDLNGAVREAALEGLIVKFEPLEHRPLYQARHTNVLSVEVLAEF